MMGREKEKRKRPFRKLSVGVFYPQTLACSLFLSLLFLTLLLEFRGENMTEKETGNFFCLMSFVCFFPTSVSKRISGQSVRSVLSRERDFLFCD